VILIAITERQILSLSVTFFSVARQLNFFERMISSTYTTDKKQTSMSSAWFEHAVPGIERPPYTPRLLDWLIVIKMRF
jgi:hypothetical protein